MKLYTPKVTVNKDKHKVTTYKETKFDGLPTEGAVILHFYPECFTPLCSSTMHMATQLKQTYEALGAVMYGVSTDGGPSVKQWAESNHFYTNMISDFHPQGELSKKFDAYDETTGLCKRTTIVLIDGEVVHELRDNDSPVDHVYGAIKALGYLAERERTE